jgi:hypothetical protein
MQQTARTVIAPDPLIRKKGSRKKGKKGWG